MFGMIEILEFVSANNTTCMFKLSLSPLYLYFPHTLSPFLPLSPPPSLYLPPSLHSLSFSLSLPSLPHPSLFLSLSKTSDTHKHHTPKQHHANLDMNEHVQLYSQSNKQILQFLITNNI